MDLWLKNIHKAKKSQFNALVKEFETNYMKRLRAMRQATDRHNVNINSPLAQTHVGFIIDTMKQNYLKIEKGKKYGGVNMSVPQAIKLAELFGCTLDYLILGRELSVDNAEIKRLEDALETEKTMRKLLEAQVEKLTKENEKLKAKKK